MSDQTSCMNVYDTYQATIGIEVHVQLNTMSKIFCSCENSPSKRANSHICHICTGQPGSLPTLNKKVVDYGILMGLATQSTINKRCSFERKHYFYPDLPKNYQITQGADPICSHGFIPVRCPDGSIRPIRLIRIHIEEDAGKSIHATTTNESFVDFNRAGTPLLEIVSYPDIHSSHQAREYLKALYGIVTYLGICSGNMEEGAFRADTNISVCKKGSCTLGTRVELKNINSFKFISDAIEYEVQRQIDSLEQGIAIQQETRLWDSKEKKTFIMRTKEEAADYRYFHDPDLPIIEIDPDWIETMRKHLPELPYEKFDRMRKEKGISEYEAGILIEDRSVANYFEEVTLHTSSKQAINWVLRDLLGYIKEQKLRVDDCKATPKKLASIIKMLEDGTINGPSAKELFMLVAQTGQEPADLIKSRGLEQVCDASELETIVMNVMSENPREVERFKAGEQKLLGFFVGACMAKTKGKGNPKLINEILKKYFNA